MITSLWNSLENLFSIDTSKNGIFREIFLAFHQAFITLMRILIISELLKLAELDSAISASFLIFFAGFVAFSFSILTKTTIIFSPSVSFSLYLIYHFIVERSWSWNMISSTLALGIISYWTIWFLGHKDTFYKAIPKELIESFHLGGYIMIFWWIVLSAGIVQTEEQKILTMAGLSLSPFTLLSFAGFFLYGLLVWRGWSVGWLMILVLYSLIDSFPSIVRHEFTINWDSFSSYAAGEQSLESLLDPSNLPPVLELSLTIFFVFSRILRIWDFQKEKFQLQSLKSWQKNRSNRMFWSLSLFISLAPALGLSLFRPIGKRLTFSHQVSDSGFSGFLTGCFILLSWFYLDYFLNIPLLVLAIPVAITSFFSFEETIPNLLVGKPVCILLPSLTLIMFIPLLFNMGFILALTILLYTILRLLSHENLESPIALAFLCLISLIIVLF